MSNNTQKPAESSRPCDCVTGKDFGVIVCRIAAVWITFQAIAAFALFLPIAIDSFQFPGEQRSLGLLIAFAGFFIYLMLGIFFWVCANPIASRMFPDANDRVLLMSIGPQQAMRILLIAVGFMFGIPAATTLVLGSANLLIELYAAATSRAGSRFMVLDPMHDYGLFRPLFTFVLSLFCIFGAGPITRFLTRMKSIELVADDPTP